MRILFIGDIVGRPGRRLLAAQLPKLRAEHQVDFAIVNGENAAHGDGITRDTAQSILDAGADCITTGNHVWSQKGASDLLAQDQRIIRPANFAPGVPGQGAWVYPVPSGGMIGVINLIGRVFMLPADCPFRTGMALVEELSRQCDALVVDMHAEATSEKQALGLYLDGHVTAVIGTHTHVQTSDEQILPGGTAFITDVGMTGPTQTVIGVKPDLVMRRFLTGMPARFEPPDTGPAALCGLLVETDGKGMRARRVLRVRVLTDAVESVS